MKKDVSKRSIMILVVLALVISVLSTFYVYTTIASYNPQGGSHEPELSPVGVGKAVLTVKAPPANADVAKAKLTVINEGG